MSPETISLSYALDTFYFLVSGALVMWMAAGFAMLEAGLVRSKNTAEILTKNVALFAIACIMFMLFGYNLMYPGENVFNSIFPQLGGVLSGADHTVKAVEASAGKKYYSQMSDFFFQVVFVATAMSIVSGAVAERMKLWSFLLFAVIFTSVIYPLQGYWNWGGGILKAKGYFDYAGSGTVHLAGAVAAFVGAKMVGARKDKYDKEGNVTPIPGANLPLATIGMFILWMGWFGFNGGSELKVSNIDSANAVALVFVNTNMAAAGGLVAALLTARLLFGKADLTMDPVGAISVHGVAGIWGLLAVLISNKEATLMNQLGGIVLITLWVAITSFIVWFVIDKVIGLRVSEEEEFNGVDISECGLEAYPEFTN